MADTTQIQVLIPADKIAARIQELAAEINRDYAGRSIVLVGVLKGSFMFLADLMRQLTIPVRLDFVGTKSYEGTTSSGEVQLTKDLDKPLRHLLLSFWALLLPTGCWDIVAKENL